MCGLYDGVVESIQNPVNLYTLAEDLNQRLVNIQSLGSGLGGLSEIEFALTLQTAVQRLRQERPKLEGGFPGFQFPPDYKLDRMLENATSSLRRNNHLLPQS